MTTTIDGQPAAAPPPSGPPVALPPPVLPPPPAMPASAAAGIADPDAVDTRHGQPRWVRPAFWTLLALTALLYLWDLGSSGWANAYYSAAAQAGSQSWTAWFFGSFDAANLITVDKPPASLWVMGLSARIFGVSAWSILVPQALMGVGAVALLFATVRRWFGPTAGLIAGTVLAVTPVAALMFRFNNPDALLVLLLVAAAYAVTRAIERGRTSWLLLAGVLVGTGFLTKMLQAYLVLPAFALAFLVAAPGSWWRRTWQLLAALGTTLVASGWWVAVVELWPADSRPYIGGSQTNSVVELLLGYNGLGRITGDEAGSVVGGGTGQAGAWGETGLTRLFTSSYGGQIAWLLPTALILLVVMLAISARARRTDRMRAAAIIWGGWLVVTALVISLSQGIIHEYYTVALAPAIGALVGIGAMALWQRRDDIAARAMLASTLVVTGAVAWLLLTRSADFLPWLRILVLGGSLALAAALLALPLLSRRVVAAVGIGALLVALAGPTAYAVQTALTPHSGSLPTAGPTLTGTRGGPGGGMRGGPGGGGTPPSAPGQTQGQTQGFPGGPGGQGQGFPGGAGAGTGGGAGGLLNASTPGAELTALLADAGTTWAAAAVGSQTAAGYQLASGQPVMALGGFNGSDPSPTLAQFQEYVASGQVHYFIAGGSGGGPGGSGSSTSSEISTWVQESFSSTTVDGVTVYDLTAPISG